MIFNLLFILLATSFSLINADVNGPLISIDTNIAFITSKVFGEHLYVSVFGNNQLHQLDARTGRFIRSFPASHVRPITSIKIIGDYIYTASEDSSVKSWSISQMKRLKTFDAHNNPVIAMDVSPNGRFLFTAAINENRIVMWDTEESQVVKRFPSEDWVKNLIVSPDGRRLYVISTSPSWERSRDVTITEWDLTNGNRLRSSSFKGNIENPDTQTAVYGDGDIFMLVNLWRENNEVSHIVRFDLAKFKAIDEFAPRIENGKLSDVKSFSLSRPGVYMTTTVNQKTDLWRVNFDFQNLILEKRFNRESVISIDQSNGGNVLWINSVDHLSSFTVRI